MGCFNKMDIVVQNYFDGIVPTNPDDIDQYLTGANKITCEEDIEWLKKLKQYIIADNNQIVDHDEKSWVEETEFEPDKDELWEGSCVDDMNVNYLLKYNLPEDHKLLPSGLYEMQVLNVKYDFSLGKAPMFHWKLKVLTEGKYEGKIVRRFNTLTNSEKTAKLFHKDLEVCGVSLGNDANIIKTPEFRDKLIGIILFVQVDIKDGKNVYYFNRRKKL